MSEDTPQKIVDDLSVWCARCINIEENYRRECLEKPCKCYCHKRKKAPARIQALIDAERTAQATLVQQLADQLEKTLAWVMNYSHGTAEHIIGPARTALARLPKKGA